MAERPAKVGKDAVLSAWDEASEGSSCFSVWWNSREKAKQYAGNDLDEARTILEKWLENNYQGTDVSLYYLRIHPDAEKAYKWNSPIIESIPFRFNPIQESYGMMGGGNYGVMQAINGLSQQLEQKHKALEDRISEMEAGGNDQDELWGKISGIIENPHIGPIIGQIISQVIGKVMNAPAMQALPRVAINGFPPGVSQQSAITDLSSQNNAVVDDEVYLKTVNDALVCLQNHCDLAADLTKLAQIAETKPEQFKMMLTMLRSF